MRRASNARDRRRNTSRCNGRLRARRHATGRRHAIRLLHAGSALHASARWRRRSGKRAASCRWRRKTAAGRIKIHAAKRLRRRRNGCGGRRRARVTTALLGPRIHVPTRRACVGPTRSRIGRASAVASLTRVLLHRFVDEVVDAALELARHLLEGLPEHVATLEGSGALLVRVRAHRRLTASCSRGRSVWAAIVIA